jgi:hypothetical protein
MTVYESVPPVHAMLCAEGLAPPSPPPPQPWALDRAPAFAMRAMLDAPSRVLHKMQCLLFRAGGLGQHARIKTSMPTPGGRRLPASWKRQ